MAETFTSIKFEYKSSTGWVDFSSDVLAAPYPQMQGMGMKGFGVTDRVGGIATLTFSVDNSAAGSRGLGGYSYFFVPGTQIHVYFEYDGIRRYKYFGYVDVGGVTVIAGQYGERRVDVKCSNIMRKLADYELDLIGYQTNKTMTQGIDLVLQNVPRRPQRVEHVPGSLYTQTFPTLFDITRTNTKAIGEIQKMVFSEYGRAFITGDGTTGETLHTEGYYTRTDYITSLATGRTPVPAHSSTVTDALLLANGVDNLLLMATGNLKLNRTQDPALDDTDWIDFQTSRTGSYTFNRISIPLTPRTVDAAATTVLWNLDKYITLAAGEQKNDIRGEYRDPNNLDTKINGIEMVTPVSGTDYAAYQNSDGTGTNYTSSLTVVATYGTADVSYSIKNNAAVTVYVTLLQARGKGVRTYNVNPITYIEKVSSQTLYDVITVDFPMPYIASSDAAITLFGSDPFNVSTGIWRNYYNTTFVFVESATLVANRTQESMMCFMCLEPGMLLNISETVTGRTAAPLFIHGYDWTIKPGKIVEWTVNFGTYDAT